eukprot:CAMPEP_0201530800 /NCGR_PEP_ID=MMETSP0161_2-20130828/45713_1 /ASSEMBLY_ACC=CAM_ASM_000251 /TAXON_ID=180227 /ORGANISM="Neoparamoeba aestuarina, Strain SoJaBio B1-5/56/2" /LENGTH=235 /DNA_ID=CAMNT_0047933331 /DNA_START=916 /DNA_END=1623 /DNA_ORIENTATION=-
MVAAAPNLQEGLQEWVEQGAANLRERWYTGLKKWEEKESKNKKKEGKEGEEEEEISLEKIITSRPFLWFKARDKSILLTPPPPSYPNFPSSPSLKRKREESEEDGEEPVKVQGKKKRVEFQIGQVIRHVRYNYRGVIVGHSETCEASSYWVMMMGVQNANQPFYNVLPHVEDRTEESYVANSNISIVTDVEINNAELGQYFSHYDAASGRYVPHSGLRITYSNDGPFAKQISPLE